MNCLHLPSRGLRAAVAEVNARRIVLNRLIFARCLPLFITLLLLMNTGCSDKKAGRSISWSELTIETMELELVDAKVYEVLMFGKKGIVAATIGEKGGPLTAPLLYWHVDGEHLFITRKPRSDPVFDLSQPRIDENLLRVKKGPVGSATYAIRQAST